MNSVSTPILDHDSIIGAPPQATSDRRTGNRRRPAFMDRRAAIVKKALSDRIALYAFGTAFAILFIVGTLSYRMLAVSTESTHWVQHSQEILENVQTLRLAMEDIESSYRGFALTGDESFLSSYSNSITNAELGVANLNTLSSDNLQQRLLLPNIKGLIAQKILFAEKINDLRRAEGFEAAVIEIRSGYGERVMAEFYTAVGDFQDQEMLLSQQRELLSQRHLNESKIVLIAGTILGLLITAATGWIAWRDGIRRTVAEESLRQSSQQYRMLVHDVQDYAIFMLDPNGKVITWNAGAERIKGYNATEIIGQSFSRFFTPDDIKLGKPEELLRLAAETGRHEEQCIRVRKNGSKFLAHVTLTALRDQTGKLVGFSEINRDLSELKDLTAKYLGLLEAAPDAMVVVNQSGKIVLLNLHAEKQFGYRRNELIGQKIKTIIPNGFADRLIADGTRSAAEVIAQQIGTGIELTGRRKDGNEFPIEIMLSPLENADGMLVTAAIRDISVRKNMEEIMFNEKERAQVTLDSIGDAVISTDTAGNIAFFNLVAENMTGWTSKEAIGRPVNEVFKILDVATRETVPSLIENAVALNRTAHLPSDSILIRRDGHEIPIDNAVSPIHDRDGHATGAVIVCRDVSAARKMSLDMVDLAEHDFLTGLPNRMLLNDRISQAIALAPRYSRQVAVLFLDLDGFKHVNDSLGHSIGDKLLQSIAKRLVSCVRISDTVSRQGGDEFVVLLSDAEQWEDVAIIAKRMLAAVAQAHTIDHHDLHITTSIGISIYPSDGQNAETLIKNADTAMYQAKENGRQNYTFFKPAMNVQAVERQSIEESLRRAIERHEFVLHYQPKLDLMTGSIISAEALIRWNHPTRGLIPPAQFIPVAEDCGLIQSISKWVMREACTQTKAWVDAGLPKISIAVNVSAIDLREDNFLEGLFAVLQETRLDPKSLEVELTESVLMKHAASAALILQALREKGIQVSIDDFGTGYSSLSYLRKFPINSLKIDQSFVRQITTAGEDTTIVTAVISMARSLNLRVIAEGVETAEELAFLKARHCDEAQGYYFSRAVPAHQFAALLETGIAIAPIVSSLPRC